MSGQIPRRMSAEITGKWRALAEQRRAHFIELYESGRWKHYYTEQELLAHMREAIRLAQTWEQLTKSPDDVKLAGE